MLTLIATVAGDRVTVGQHVTKQCADAWATPVERALVMQIAAAVASMCATLPDGAFVSVGLNVSLSVTSKEGAML